VRPSILRFQVVPLDVRFQPVGKSDLFTSHQPALQQRLFDTIQHQPEAKGPDRPAVEGQAGPCSQVVALKGRDMPLHLSAGRAQIDSSPTDEGLTDLLYDRRDVDLNPSIAALYRDKDLDGLTHVGHGALVHLHAGQMIEIVELFGQVSRPGGGNAPVASVRNLSPISVPTLKQ